MDGDSARIAGGGIGTLLVISIIGASPTAAQSFPELEPGTITRMCHSSGECVEGLLWYVAGDTLGMQVRGREVVIPIADVTAVAVPVNVSRLRRSGAIRGGLIGGGAGALLAVLTTGGFLESRWDQALLGGIGFVVGAPIGAYLGASVGPEDSDLEWVTLWRRQPQR